jgi:hypothetical protein
MEKMLKGMERVPTAGFHKRAASPISFLLRLQKVRKSTGLLLPWL